ncbi:MAG: SDR family oxidoreductase [Chloroflexi bacterium]|nr:SDR family oxidoreductase [Chloroflexota bacterium]
MRLQDRVALITGAGHGIGRVYALGFAREGAAIVVGDIDGLAAAAVAQEIEQAGGPALGLRMDVADAASVEAAVAAALQRFGKIDILVNNAALFRAVPMTQASVEEIPLAEWDRMMAVNLRGPFLCVRACLPGMKQQQYGKVINISSTRAFRQRERPGRSGAGVHYNVSKAGVLGLTRALASELGRYNICVNTIAPGGISLNPGVAGAAGQASTEKALKRPERAEDILGPAIFLAASESDYVIGQTLVVDGGDVML